MISQPSFARWILVETTSFFTGDAKYNASGVVGQDGCIYFAPYDAGKVLRITGEGNVELLEPEIPGHCKYSAGGVVGQDGCIYFAPCDAVNVLCVKF